jgi:hypothetical protein
VATRAHGNAGDTDRRQDVTNVEISTEDVAKWLPVVGLLVALKILPGKWKVALAAVGAGLAIWKYSEQG